MRIIFAGTPEIAADILGALIEAKHNIVAVLTQPDRPKGRGQKITASPVKEIAIQHNIPVLQPQTLKTQESQQQLRDLNADLMIVMAYGLILPQAVLDIPKHGCINIHASILPRWRGAAPIQHAILAGDTQSGITIMQMDKGLDTGAILATYPCEIVDTETSASLYAKLTTLAQHAIVDFLQANKFNPTAQNNDLATYAHKIDKQHAKINWQQSAVEIDRLIRAYNPWPIAFTEINQQVVRIHKAKLSQLETTQAPGTIVTVDKDGIHVATEDGVIILLELQFPGKNVLPAQVVVNANAVLIPGACFS